MFWLSHLVPLALRVTGYTSTKIIHCCWSCEKIAWSCRYSRFGDQYVQFSIWIRLHIFSPLAVLGIFFFVLFDDGWRLCAAVQKRGYVDLQEMAREDCIPCCYGTTLPKDPTCTLACSWTQADPSSFLIRGENYLEDHKKVCTTKF